MDEVKVYTVQEVADILKMTTGYIYDRVEDGSLVCCRLGNKLRFTPEQIKEFLYKKEERS